MQFSNEFFQTIDLTEEQIKQYFENAKKDFEIAEKSDEEKIIFQFCYNAIIKLGIAKIAEKGYKVRSIPGHHIKILETLEELTGLKKEINFIQRIRRKRNIDFYEGGVQLTQKECEELLKITKKLFSNK